MPARKSDRPRNSGREKAELRERGLLMLEAFEREESSPTWAGLRSLLESTNRIADLRSVLREMRGIQGAMSSTGRARLQRALEDQFGPDEESQKDLAVVEKVCARGRIGSEREYRAVQSYADSVVGESDRESELATLGALLDDYMTAPKLSSER